MNNESSRSHSIFTITVEILEKGAPCEIWACSLTKGSSHSCIFALKKRRLCFEGMDGQDHIRVGKMNMVDLAGSERQSKTGATGETLKEAPAILRHMSCVP